MQNDEIHRGMREIEFGQTYTHSQIVLKIGILKIEYYCLLVQ